MKRKVAALAMASGIALAVVAPTAAQADAGGVPNDSACHGQILSDFNASGDLTVGKLAQLFREAGIDITAGDLNKGVQAFCKA